MWVAAAAGAAALAAAALWRISSRSAVVDRSSLKVTAEEPAARSGAPEFPNYTIVLFNNSSGGKQA
jgi:hypothetical protein